MKYRIGRPGEGEHEGAYVLSGAMERVSWSAIFAGVAAAMAVQILLALFGVAAGFASLDVAGAEAVGIGALAFWVFSAIASLFTGGFVAGRMAGVPLMPSAVLHGAVVWSVVTVLSAVMAVSGASAIVSGASRMAVQMGDAVIDASGELASMAPDDLADVLPDALSDEISESLGDNTMSPQEIRTEAREIARAVIDQSQRDEARRIVRETGMRVLRSPGEIEETISNGMNRLMNVVGPEDRQQLIAELGDRFDLTENEANELIDRWEARIGEMGVEVQARYREIAAQVAEAADEVAEQVAAAAFWAALATFLGLVAASAGALMGRPEDLLEVELAEQRTQAAE